MDISTRGTYLMWLTRTSYITESKIYKDRKVRIFTNVSREEMRSACYFIKKYKVGKKH